MGCANYLMLTKMSQKLGVFVRVNRDRGQIISLDTFVVVKTLIHKCK